MKIYTLLFGILFVSPTQAQTMHDWENHHVLQINREPARAAFTPFSVQKGDGSISLDGTWKFRWTPVPNERVMNFYQTNFNDKDNDIKAGIQHSSFSIVQTHPEVCHLIITKID